MLLLAEQRLSCGACYYAPTRPSIRSLEQPSGEELRYWSTAWSSRRHLGVFGVQKRCKGDHWTSRALGATLPERRRQVALTSLIRATLPERRGEVARVFIARIHENGPGATSRNDPSRSLSKPGATSRSDYWRSLRASCLFKFMFTQGPFGHFIMHVFTF
ncbi:hypothetical protein F2Q69_00055078 [Brassica cretica]|uniref:Uncharacterized protein n=1 Tax=Brassica cretica TaxID=69181 RepID=A0A8S9MVS8_BRACR|nr:hypothetical protein F2Q69_00055078 [Brassica cretica]